MDAKLKADWVAALRSGEYQQNDGCIREGDRLCCIGVGAVVSGRRRDELWCTEEEASALGLPPLMRAAIIQMNDDEKKSFPEIADWIEANIPADTARSEDDRPAVGTEQRALVKQPYDFRYLLNVEGVIIPENEQV